MKKKKLIIIITAVILLIVLIFLIVFLGDKKLDINSQIVADLHNSLGEVDINKCGGLITYTGKTMTESDLDIENRLCMAFYNLSDNQIVSETIKSNEENSDGTKICKIGESTTLATTNEEETECSYKVVEAKDLKSAYLDFYGKEITEQDSFYISEKEACYKEGERYYCGNSENYKISITSEATIYRLINKAVETSKGEIVIYDYFLKISNNTCYLTNTNDSENKECSQKLESTNLENDEEIISLVKKYGNIYKHTFKEDKNKNHFWFKTELKK